MRLRTQRPSAELPLDHEYVPGRGVVRKLDQTRRWRLAGEYTVMHRLVGPWYRRVCAACGTRGRCGYRRWAGEILLAEVRREWLGQ
jgi:hypothetical protein